jgi:hypothetical protein
MPGLRHDGLVALVRQHPPLAVDLVRLMEAYPLPDDVVAVLGSEDMTDVTPITGKPQPKPQTYAADSVVIASDQTTGERLLAIIVEPQGEASDDKDISWPVYATTARKANLRSLMMSIPYKDPLTEHWAAAGRKEGREEGRVEGIEQGLARAKGEDLLKIMEARSLMPSEKQRAQVTSSTDLGQLDLWFDRALTADSADEVFRS